MWIKKYFRQKITDGNLNLWWKSSVCLLYEHQRSSVIINIGGRDNLLLVRVETVKTQQFHNTSKPCCRFCYCESENTLQNLCHILQTASMITLTWWLNRADLHLTSAKVRLVLRRKQQQTLSSIDGAENCNDLYTDENGWKVVGHTHTCAHTHPHKHIHPRTHTYRTTHAHPPAHVYARAHTSWRISTDSRGCKTSVLMVSS